MANVNTTARPKATIQPSSSVVIHNFTCTLANTEYSQVLTGTSVKKLTIRCRGIANMRLAYASGETTVEWFTIPKGCTYTEEDIDINGSIYFQTDKAAQVVEIVEWF
jgi:hypothetical protein